MTAARHSTQRVGAGHGRGCVVWGWARHRARRVGGRPEPVAPFAKHDEQLSTMDFDFYSYPYAGMLLDTDCKTELSAAVAAAAPAVWFVVVKQEGPFLSRIVCAVRTKAAAVARAAAHEAAHEDDRGETFITGYRVETGAVPAVFVATTTIQVGHAITAVSEVKAKASAVATAEMVLAENLGIGDEGECKVQRFEVSDA